MIPSFSALPTDARYTAIANISAICGWCPREIAANLGICENTARTALAWYQNPTSLGHAGRPKLLTHRHYQYIAERTIAERRLTNQQLAAEIPFVFPELRRVSHQTIARCRHELDFQYLSPLSEIQMSNSALNQRVLWCQHQQEIGLDWTRVIFSDESWFEIGANVRKIWRRPHEDGPDVCCAHKHHPEKVMIWGAIGYNYKSELHFVPANTTIDAEYYFENIVNGGFIDTVDAVHPDYDWFFQQDNARPHVARTVLESIAELDVSLLPNWPPYSPDLNIIERVWAIMKGMIALRDPKNRHELCDVIEQVWRDLRIETINALVAEMPQRLITVIRRGGRTIQHL
jgi:hypothetical protein